MSLHLRNIPTRAAFLKALSAAEIGTGVIVLLPVVPNKVAGAVLSAFAGGLVALYLRTPALRKPGSDDLTDRAGRRCAEATA
jgi:hypothetical protein